jgi:hypothetical protein
LSRSNLAGIEELFHNEVFHSLISDTSLKSARIIIPLVLKILKPNSIVDIGCGVGAWLSIFKEHGIEDLLGIDGHYVNQNTLMIPKEQFSGCDLKKAKININKRFDLALCLEVAQYLPRENSELFITSLTELAPVVIFSSATPFQGGPLQINERWPHEWAAFFQKRGYKPIDCIRKKIWNNKDVALWYAQNMIMYAREDYIHKISELQKEYERSFQEPLSMVHPDLWDSKMNYLYGGLKEKGIKSRIKNFLRKFIFHDEYTSG